MSIGASTAKWNDLHAWPALIDGSACPICLAGHPLDVLSGLESGWVTMQEAAPVRGYVCLVSRIHAVELHDLQPGDAQAFMRDACRVSRVLSAITGAVKLNYEIHGNTLPHLHMHFFPRHRGDLFEGKPIDPRAVRQPVYRPGEFGQLRERILAALGDDAA
jgi:diadenosine tetraphosphate (Ap4A) HIT family hydrolase